MTGVLSLVLCLACYKGLLVSAAASVLQLGAWAKLLQVNILSTIFVLLYFLLFYVQDAVITLCLALVSLQLYLGVTSLDKY